MRRSPYFVHAVLVLLFGAALLGMVVVRAFLPDAIFPKPDIPAMALLSLLALLVDHYFAPDAPRRYGRSALFAALAFSLLPWVCGFVTLGEAVRLGVIGGAVFTAVLWLFTSLQQRLAVSDASPAAPMVCALGLSLAFQGFLGILL